MTLHNILIYNLQYIHNINLLPLLSWIYNISATNKKVTQMKESFIIEFARTATRKDDTYESLQTSINERESLLLLLNSGRNISAIARILGWNKSTISRELKRNSTNDCYLAVNADKSYHSRRKRCRRNKCFDNPNFKAKVQNLFLNCQ